MKRNLIRILQYTAEIYYEESMGKTIWQAAKMSLCDDYVYCYYSFIKLLEIIKWCFVYQS